MWSVCSCPLSDRLVCSPAVLLFPSSSFSASCVLFSSCLVIGVSLSGFRTFASAIFAQLVAVSSLPRPAHSIGDSRF